MALNRPSQLIIMGGLALLAGVFLAALFPQRITHSPTLSLVARGCNLNDSSCLIQSDGMRMELMLQPQPVPLLRTITLSGTFAGIALPEQVQLDITGVNMDMGVQHVDVQLDWSQQTITAQFQLPVCSAKTMDWQARLTFQTATGNYDFLYPFRTDIP